MLTLTAIQGPDAGKKFQLPPGEPQLIGRSTEALPITDTTVSRRHAELTPDGSAWYIRDLDSQNGTYLNGVLISKRIRLQLGDQIRVGSSLFVYGQAPDNDPAVVRIAHESEMDTDIEHRLASNEDSMVLAVPEPRAAAVDHLRVIYELTKLTTRTPDPLGLVQSVLELVFAEMGPERGVVMLAGEAAQDGSTPGLRVVAFKRAEPPAPGEDQTIHVSQTIIKAAMEDDEGVLSSNAMGDPRFEAGDSVQRYSIRSAICSPINFQDRKFGAIYVDSSIANYTFTAEQLALMNAIGRHTALALANFDQTARRVQAERLAAVGEAVASVSHSIKNILQGLRGGADVVEIGLNKGDARIAKNGWQILKRNLDRIAGLTMNMLVFSRPRTLELERTRLGELAEDCAQLLAAQCADKGVALLIDADPEMPPLAVDANLMHQVLMNIISNAVEAAPEKTGVVTVKVLFHEPQGGGLPARGQLVQAPWAEIRVLDNGPGIPQDRLGWIFEPFNTTKGMRGTGLGLAVSRRIVAEHMGRIRVETAEGKGSNFRIFIPSDLDEQMDPSETAEDRAKSVDLLGGI